MSKNKLIAALACGAVWLLLAAPVAGQGAGAEGASWAYRNAVADGVVSPTPMTADEAYERGQGGEGVQKDFKGGVMLYDTTLVEDDGPGAGGEDKSVCEEQRSPVEEVNARTMLKKILIVDRPEAVKATLYVREGEAKLTFNGKALAGGGKFTPVPVELIRKGANELIISAAGDVKMDIKVAARRHILENNPELKDRPPRSFKSTDGGRSWQAIDGELTVRLNLTQYPAEGSFISRVIDLAAQDDNSLPLADVAVRAEVSVSGDADLPPGTGVDFALRTGSTPVYEKGSWTDWQPGLLAGDKCQRFVQWKAILKTDDPRVTPVLKRAALVAKADSLRPAWLDRVAVKSFNNEEIRYTSLPFEYEDPNHPKMRALRQKYKLDEVIKDGKTELEKLALLRHWVGQQWKFKGPTPVYPPWDADAIMTMKTGFCVQFAIVYIQCCNALGYPARYVCGWHPETMKTAHEVSEVWSNEYKKWIFMDPTPSQNQFHVDPPTKTPLSLLEVHDRMMHHYYGTEKPATPENAPKAASWTDDIGTVKGLELSVVRLSTSKGPPPTDWPSWTKWLLLCYMPRNNFSGQSTPLPRIQGMNNWDWPGLRQWYDEQAPRDGRYRHNVSRRSDISWTINQVRFAASAGEQPGQLKVQMGTFTPYFETYLVNVDGQGWKKSDRSLVWTLHGGVNRLEMRVRNTSGVEGPVSFMELELPKP